MENRPYQQPPVPLNLETGKEYVLATHFVDYATSFPVPKHLKSEWGMFSRSENLEKIVSIILPEYDTYYLRNGVHNDKYSIVIASVLGMLCLLFWLLFYLNPLEKNLLLIAITCTVLMGNNYFGYYFNTFDFSLATHQLFGSLFLLSVWLTIGIMPILLSQLLLSKI